MMPVDPIDMAAIAKFKSDHRDDDGSLLAELVAAFAEEAHATLLASSSPAVKESRVILSTRVQRLKKTAAILGARQVVTLCERIAAADRADNGAGSVLAFSHLESALARAISALQRLLNA
jgi:HPt (histidine-containing phosphotransfer) domain-containing protein